MADRITRKIVESRIAHLNKVFNAFSDTEAARPYQIEMANGYYKVVSHGGSVNVSSNGTAKETYNFINGMLAGVQSMITYP